MISNFVENVVQRGWCISKQFYLLLDQTNCQVDPRSLKFKKNIYGKPEVSLFSDH
jgi:hypothetical protein